MRSNFTRRGRAFIGASVFAFYGGVAGAGVFDMPAGQTSLQLVPVGNAGNSGDFATGFGAVPYGYQVGRYEVTAGQYTTFLNAVAKTDTYGLYNSNMWTDTYGCKIEQSGSPGSYTYTVAADYANRPVNYVSWGDSARFTNWLTHGQPTGTQGLNTTEDGSYYLNGATSASDILSITRRSTARYVVPTENEWYKAAYYDPAKSGGAGYWDYATRTNLVPSAVSPANDTGNSINCRPTPDTFAIGGPYYTTPVGSYQQSQSAYGTSDQCGNVWEWNEAIRGSNRGRRGASFWNVATYSQADYPADDNPTVEQHLVGFRVAALPQQVRTYAYCAGSDHWVGPIPKVRGEADANAIDSKLRAFPSYARSTVQGFNYTAESNDSRTLVFNSLATFEADLKPDDTFVFFFSGHGGGGTGENEWISLNRTGDGRAISDDQLTAWFNSTDIVGGRQRQEIWASVNKLFILDSCHSGGFGTSDDGKGSNDPDLSALPRTAVLAACGETEFTYSKGLLTDRPGRGQFSLLVEEALELVNGFARADVDRDGVEFEELRDFVATGFNGMNQYDGYIRLDPDADDLTTYSGTPVLYSFASPDYAGVLAVPEPASVSLFVVGAIGLLCRRRRAA